MKIEEKIKKFDLRKKIIQKLKKKNQKDIKKGSKHELQRFRKSFDPRLHKRLKILCRSPFFSLHYIEFNSSIIETYQ